MATTQNLIPKASLCSQSRAVLLASGEGGSGVRGTLERGNVGELASLFGLTRASQVPRELRNSLMLSLSFRHKDSEPTPKKMPRSVQMGM